MYSRTWWSIETFRDFAPSVGRKYWTLVRGYLGNDYVTHIIVTSIDRDNLHYPATIKTMVFHA